MSIHGKVGASLWWRDALPHTNQLGLGKRCWNLETSSAVVEFPPPYHNTSEYCDIGCIQDIVDLIESLESACIRFVHFSKENELRSRVSLHQFVDDFVSVDL